MKIIDLLNKIANGDIPKKIKYDDRLYTFNKDKDNYESEMCFINWDYVSLHCLNEEVEIIEEDKKIEKLDLSDTFCGESLMTTSNYKIQNKINEIIDKLNEMRNKNDG